MECSLEELARNGVSLFSWASLEIPLHLPRNECAHSLSLSLCTEVKDSVPRKHTIGGCQSLSLTQGQ